jgi:glycosyltransferase involved in cell wall biosynthesis
MTRPVRVLELRSVFGTGGGPDKTILAGAAATDPSEVAVTLCYLRDERDPLFPIRERARDLGLDYVEIRERGAWDTRAWKALGQLVREGGIDIVHAHEYKTDLLAYLLAKRAGVVPLATAHGWTGHSWRERRVYYPADRRLLAHFPRVIAVSGEIKQTLVRAGASADRVEVLLNGIDANHFRRDRSVEAAARLRFGVAAGDVVIGAVGRLEPQKRFDLLIDAFVELQRTRPALRLLIAGEGSQRPALERKITGLGDSGRRVSLVGQVDVIPFHHALDLFVQSSEYEGTPNVVLEAMAMETPIVATDVGGTSELAADGEHAIIVPAGRVDRLAGAMATLLGDGNATAARVRQARSRVEAELSFGRRVAAVNAVYRSVLLPR